MLLLALAGWGGSAPARAYDYVIYTHTQSLTTTDWSLSYTLPGYVGTQDIAAILITYETSQFTRFKMDNDDPGSGYDVTSNLSGTLTLTFPGSGTPSFSNTLSGSQLNHVDADDGDGGIADYTAPDGFNILLQADKSGVYSVPSTDFHLFVNTPVAFNDSAVATSSFSGAPSNLQQSIATAAAATVTLQFVLVPEAGTACAAAPFLALVVGAWLRRRRA